MIDLVEKISDPIAVKSGGFTGAIFLTYSLNLNFFEQILLPALDQAGCSNILILTDPDGYQQSLEFGSKSVLSAGRNYVCVPVLRTGQGVQHGKMLFMVGPSHGRLFIGSGNLTFQGYGRNLELYSHFECLSSNPDDHSPFIDSWKLIQKLCKENVSEAVAQQIRLISERVKWLENSSLNREHIVWHNYKRSLFDQLIEWRHNKQFTDKPRNIKVISPFYDVHLKALKYLSENISPGQIHMHLDRNMTNLKGEKAANKWAGRSPKIHPFEIKASRNQAALRHIHAKAIVGREKNGSWVISGSANMSLPAMMKTWQEGGNLELVTFFWSNDAREFDYLFEDEAITIREIKLTDIKGLEEEPQQKESTYENKIFLSDLSLSGTHIQGKLSAPFPNEVRNAILHFNKSNLETPVHFTDNQNFSVQLPAPLVKVAESAKIVIDNFETPYRWIDQLDVLIRHGARLYQSQIKGKIETLAGAGKLFQDLMDFLWNQVLPENEKKHDPQLSRHSIKKQAFGAIDDDTFELIPPPPSEFIVDEELISTIQLALEYHDVPYDRSLLSLQDLLSLVLLRLTTQTSSILADSGLSEEELEQKTQPEQEEERVDILQQLGNYLFRYCHRYGNRLLNREFLQGFSPETIFRNQYILGKILIEFQDKTKEHSIFSQEDLSECFWFMWGPLICPQMIGINGTSTFDIFLEKHNATELQQAWQNSDMPSLVVMMFAQILQQPPSWHSGIWQPEVVDEFLGAQKLTNLIKNVMGQSAFSLQHVNLEKLIGVRTINDLFTPTKIDKSTLTYWSEIFFKIENYRSPIEEKFYDFFELEKEVKAHSINSSQAQTVIERIKGYGLSKEVMAYLGNPKPIRSISEDDEGEFHCPICGVELTDNLKNDLIRGSLVLCHYSKDTWMYLKTNPPLTLFEK